VIPSDSTTHTRKLGSLMTEHEAANLLACSVATMRKWRLMRRPPNYYRIGRLVRYSREDLAAFLDIAKVGTEPRAPSPQAPQESKR
jgi:excisionase family DNA binding protein